MRPTEAAAAIALATAVAACAPPSPQIELGERRQGVLDAGDPSRARPPHGHAERWTFRAAAGTRIVAAAESFELDPFLLLLDSEGRRLAWDDDSGGLGNARLRAEISADGRHTLVVSGATRDHRGTYWLTLTQESREPTNSAAELDDEAVFAAYHRGLEWAGTDNPRAESWLELGLARYLAQRHRLAAAEDHLRRGRSAAEAAGFAHGRWAAALTRGQILADRMRYGQAIGAFHQALDLARELRSAAAASAEVWTQLGDLYQYLLREEEAVKLYRRALELAESSGDVRRLAAVYLSLAQFHGLRWGEAAEAESWALKALELSPGLGPEIETRALYTLALSVHQLPPRLPEVVTRARAARARAARLRLPEDETLSLLLLATAHRLQGELTAAIDAAHQASAVAGRLADPELLREALQLAALSEGDVGDHQAALTSCLTALGTVERAWAEEPTDELQRDYLAQARVISTQVLSHLYALEMPRSGPDLPSRAFAISERTRSRALLEQLAARSKATAVPLRSALGQRQQQLVAELSAVSEAMIALRHDAAPSLADLDRLEEQQARLQRERMWLQQGLAWEPASAAPLSAPRVQEGWLADRPRTAVLSYQLGGAGCFLWVLTRDEIRWLKLAVDRPAVNAAVAEWRRLIREQTGSDQLAGEDRERYARSAGGLYDLLVRPAAPWIEGFELIVVPDGALHHLAFEALISAPGATPRYLIEDHAVLYAPSLSVLAALDFDRRRSPPSRALLIGDPDFRQAVSRSGGAADQEALGAGLESLPWTRHEVLQIAASARNQGWQATVWLGQEASEERLKDADLTSWDLLHLATHAVPDHRLGGSSAVVLSPGTRGGEDGVLTADEILRSNLGAALVVLSGCETGAGEESAGEGVIGLGRAFMVAGARQVCASLWKVEDRPTQGLMTDFYGAWLGRGLPPSRALRTAKLAAVGRGAPPAAWAAFLLAGPDG